MYLLKDDLPNMESEWIDKVFSVSPDGFQALALAVFRFQYGHNALYRSYADALRVTAESVDTLARIPFLPISLFKSHRVATTNFEPQLVFESSGTTQTTNSRHFVRDASIYNQSFTRTFRQYYHDPSRWCILGLLPSYLERSGSSLTLMASELISMSRHPQSGFYIDDHEKLRNVLLQLEARQQPTLLLGVTFGLLDFAEKYQLQLRHTVIMETGGMKGRRREMTREELHTFLKERLGVPAIHSEYGMTELLSQAYSTGEGIYRCPSWMRVLLREEDDPLQVKDPAAMLQPSLRGAINVIDLANIYSCSFIATDDSGKFYADGSFEVLGRMDNSDIRGCSMLAL